MYLGLDLGTSGLKALLIDAQQRVVASVTAPLTLSRPFPGWSEQAPQAWIAAAERTLDELKAEHGAELAAVEGIGLSGQMHGATLLDGAGEVLRPCILWNDTRSHLEAARLDAEPRFRAISGNIAIPMPRTHAARNTSRLLLASRPPTRKDRMPPAARTLQA